MQRQPKIYTREAGHMPVVMSKELEVDLLTSNKNSILFKFVTSPLALANIPRMCSVTTTSLAEGFINTVASSA
jgi:hypothetical protein